MKADKAKFDIPLVLPEVHDGADRCVERLLAVLKARAGVDDAHIDKSNGDTLVLCVHFNRGTLSLPQVRSIVEAAGADISARFGHMVWELSQTFSARQANRISDQLAKIPGVLEAGVSPAGAVRIEFDRTLIDELAVRAALERLGLRQKAVVEEDHAGHDHGPGEHGHDHEHGGIFGSWTELVFALGCGLTLAIGFAIEKLADSPAWLPLGCYILAYALGGFFTLREAFQNLKSRRFEIDTLMLVAAAGAAALGAWAEGALLLFLFSMGHALEHYAMGRAKRAIEALSKLAPRTAMVRQSDGTTREVPVEQLALGDVLAVKPDERIPADGFVVRGSSAVNQAPVTGESMPVDKRAVMDDAAARANPDRLEAAFRVFAGTINGSGALEIEVTRLASESTLAKVIKLVSEAETQKSPTQRFTDKFERYFVPTVLGLTLLLLFAWVVVDEPFRASFYRAMAVLVAASPCALAIATPSAVLSGVARAARGGVLIKGGAPLELLGSLDAIAFDKTGTLTKGEPHIQEIVPAPGIAKQDLMVVAIAVESQSDHPIAQSTSSARLT
ncbi:HAD family hydrolase [Chakrabartia godavariana]|nr:HAD family hydrolase [Chakrabartia godavariana]